MIPYGRQTINDDDIKAVVEVLKSDWLTTGPKIAEFEAAFAEYVGADHAIAFSNGTAALHGAVSSLELPEGSEIITTPLTFVATANSILYSNCVPVFADVREDTLLLNPESVAKEINSKTRAIMPVDYAGQPCEYDELKELAEEHDLAIISDACHSLGAYYCSYNTGPLVDMTVFSLHPVKLITSGEGGMVTTENGNLASYLRGFRNHGRGPLGSEFLGYNYRMTDIQAALGLSQLRRADEFLHQRKLVAEIYDRYFSNNDKVTPLAVREDVYHAYHLYVIKVDDRAKAMKLLNDAGVTTTIHYPLIHKHYSYHREFWANCPVAERVANNIISLPIYPTLTMGEQMVVIKALERL